MFKGSGTWFAVIWFSRDGVSGSLFRVFEVRGFGFFGFSRYGVSGSLLRVFDVRGFRYGVYCTRFAVRGSGGSVLHGSR